MESTFTLKKSDFEAKVGAFLGYGRGSDAGATAWDTEQQANIDDYVRSGYHQFLWPPRIPGETKSHSWSFLRPVASLTLVSGDSTVQLPDDFGALTGSIDITISGGIMGHLVPTSVDQVYALHACQPNTTGQPREVAIEWLKGTTAVSGQRARLKFFPTCSQAYTVQLAYTINPDHLSGSKPYFYGGAVHAETILESMLAVAESRGDDVPVAQGANHYQRFMERLSVSVDYDRHQQAQSLGYNLDYSDGIDWSRYRRFSKTSVYTP